MPAFDLRLEVPAFARPSARVRRPKWALFAFLAVCAVLATAGGWFLGVRKAPSTPPQAQGETVAAPAASTAPPEKAVPLAPSKTSARSKSAPPAAALAAEPEAEVVTWIRGDTGSSSSNTAKDDGETAAPPVVGLPQTNAQLAAIPTGSPAAPRAPAAPARAVEANAAPLRVLPQTMLARAVHRVTPDYPPEARQAGIAGSVDLLVIVGTDGKVEMAAPVSGPPVLAVAAAKALKQWRFQPYAPDAKPLRVETTITVVFRRP
jgi:protein TonB